MNSCHYTVRDTVRAGSAATLSVLALTAAILFIASTVANVAAADRDCPDGQSVWAHGEAGDRQIFYFEGGGIPILLGVYLEQWSGADMLWRARGLYTCSNGASVCKVFFETMRDRQAGEHVVNPVGNPETSAVIELIDTDSDGQSDWVVLAGLWQSAYYEGGLNAYPQAAEPDDIRLPKNQFSYLTCKESGVLDRAPEDIAGWWATDLDLCEAGRPLRRGGGELIRIAGDRITTGDGLTGTVTEATYAFPALDMTVDWAATAGPQHVIAYKSQNILSLLFTESDTVTTYLRCR